MDDSRAHEKLWIEDDFVTIQRGEDTRRCTVEVTTTGHDEIEFTVDEQIIDTIIEYGLVQRVTKQGFDQLEMTLDTTPDLERIGRVRDR